MAQIPVIDQPSLGQGGEVAIPRGVDVRTGESLLAQGLQSVGVAADRVLEQIQRAENQTRAIRVTQFNNQFMRVARENLHGDGGYFSKQGFDALDTKNAHKSVDDVMKNFAGQLSDEKSRALFEAEASTHALTLHTEIERHSSQQREVWNKQVHDDTINSTIWEAQRYTNQPDKVQEIVARDLPKIVALKQALGQNSSQQVKQTAGHIYASILSQFVSDGRAVLAQPFLESKVPVLGISVKDAMGPLGDSVERAIATAASDERGQMFATDAVTKFGGNYVQALNFLRGEASRVLHGDLTGTFKNSHEAKIALDYLLTDQKSVLEARDRTMHTVLNDGIQWFEQHPATTGKPITWDQFAASAPPLLKAQLRASGGWEALHKWRIGIEQAEQSAPPTPEQDFSFLRFMEFKNNQDEAFANLDPSAVFKYRAYLHPDQWRLAMHMWNAVAEKNGPVFQMSKKLEGAIMNILEANSQIPSRSIPGGEQRGKPDTWTPEHRRVWETALILGYDGFNTWRRNNQGKAPEPKDIFPIASAAVGGHVLTDRWLSSIRGPANVPITQAVAEGKRILGVEDLAPDSPQYQMYLQAWRIANPNDPDPARASINAMYYQTIAQSLRYSGQIGQAEAIEAEVRKLQEHGKKK